MARGAVAVSPVRALAGGAAAAFLLTLTLGTLGAVAWRAEGLSGLGAADWAAIRFTLGQALVSAALSVLLAVPVARALARRRFPGRSLVVALLGAPFILPVIVAVFGLIAVFGRAGLLNQAGAALGLPEVAIYGPQGVVLAHVFFNMPLATRFLLQGWLAIPAEQFRLAASLGFTPAAVARHLEWPMLRAVVPGTFLAIFLICLTSFAVALAVGGGPRATTIELRIYELFRFDFALGDAALLGLVQFAVCAVAALVAGLVTVPKVAMAGLDGVAARWDARGAWLRAQDAAVIGLACAFLLVPMGIVALRGVPFVAVLPMSVWQAAGASLAVALCSTLLALALSLSLALWVSRGGRAARIGGDIISGLALTASPLVMGTGLFILLFGWTSPQALALPVTGLVNAAITVPFTLRVLAPAVAEIEEAYGKLAASLGLTGWTLLRRMILPRLRRPLGFSAGLAAALSMGDLGVIALFSAPETETLPLAMYRLMAAYRTDLAAGAGLVLVALSFGLFYALDRGGRGDVDA
ncbi:MAG: thiamine/thiamine pyrophosphate ABC transporter permease ThiP [Pseudomonadota bacterium]